MLLNFVMTIAICFECSHLRSLYINSCPVDKGEKTIMLNGGTMRKFFCFRHMWAVPVKTAIFVSLPAVLQGPQCCCLLSIQVRQTWWISTLHTVLQLFGAQCNGTRWMEEAVVQKHAGHTYVQIQHFMSQWRATIFLNSSYLTVQISWRCGWSLWTLLVTIF